MTTIDLIRQRRDGEVQSRAAFDALCAGARDGTIPDYQLSAWLMAAYLRPLTPSETADLTLAMAESGTRIPMAGLPRPWLDKHSTGGVGDKMTLLLGPLFAACGLTTVKLSGRGLGITGGTIDKLESIPGFQTQLSVEALRDQANRIGFALGAQTQDLAPADRVLYALRDVTATIESIPLITASILSKKIAGGCDHLVLDVKYGRGAFMPTFDAARALAASLRTVGTAAGLRVRTLVTDMDEPLGAAVGNALEVAEAHALLRHPDAADPRGQRLLTLANRIAVEALTLTGTPVPEAESRVETALRTGAAHAKFTAWITEQGGDLSRLPIAAYQTPILAETAGTVTEIDPAQIAGAVVALGGGRATKADVIRPEVGAILHVSRGDQVRIGDPLLTVHSAHPIDAHPIASAAAWRAGFQIVPGGVPAERPLATVVTD
ncbi:MAG: thymidine phosphorylase [Fimbriimonadaceae bacterium]|nr:thymidine phosphorylase [Fimbriimonadaceae bacterium]